MKKRIKNLTIEECKKICDNQNTCKTCKLNILCGNDNSLVNVIIRCFHNKGIAKKKIKVED